MPARSAVLAVCLKRGSESTLVWPLGSGGLAAATAVCSYVQVAMLAMALQRRFGRAVLAGLGRALGDTAFATLCMGAAVVAVRYLLTEQSTSLVLLAAVLSA